MKKIKNKNRDAQKKRYGHEVRGASPLMELEESL